MLSEKETKIIQDNLRSDIFETAEAAELNPFKIQRTGLQQRAISDFPHSIKQGHLLLMQVSIESWSCNKNGLWIWRLFDW